MPKFGIVLITHNNANHIVAGVDSVVAQTDPRWACHVVDNGSTDDTVAALLKRVGDDTRFHVHRKDNAGPSSGRNYGFRSLPSDTDYVVFLDGDDCLGSAFLEALGQYLDEHPDVGLVACQHEVIDESGRGLGPGYRSRYAPGRLGLPRRLRDDEYDTPFVTFFAATGQGPFALFRRLGLARTSLYDERMWSHEDSDIFCQMALLAKVHYLPVRLYRKRVHAANLTGSSRANYGLFRDKWDHYEPKDAKESAVLQSARRYYDYRHSPLRELKVGLLALRDVIRHPTMRGVRWMASRFYYGLTGFIRGRSHARAANVAGGQPS